MHHLVGIIEIGQLLGASRQRADRLTKKNEFPAPIADLASGRIWERDKVEAWARAIGRIK